MKIKIRKNNKDGIVKVESGGKIKEFIFKEDIFNKEKSSLLVCFKGVDSSGIIELSPEDVDYLYKEIVRRKKYLNDLDIINFSK